MSFGKTVESIVLDFKREIDLSNSKGKSKNSEEFALDICQFSNTWGGVLLIGVVEKYCEAKKAKVAHSIKNVDNYEEISCFINDKVIPVIHPPPLDITIVPIDINDKTIVAINIPPIERSLSCTYSLLPPFQSKFPYRTHHGKKYFRPADVEKIISMNHKHLVLRLNELTSVTREVTLYPNLIKEEINKNTWDNQGESVIIEKVANSEYTLNIASLRINIPYSFTNDVWLTESGKIGIFLNIKICQSSDRRELRFDI